MTGKTDRLWGHCRKGMRTLVTAQEGRETMGDNTWNRKDHWEHQKEDREGRGTFETSERDRGILGTSQKRKKQ